MPRLIKIDNRQEKEVTHKECGKKSNENKSTKN
jgi:hypothetical protein